MSVRRSWVAASLALAALVPAATGCGRRTSFLKHDLPDSVSTAAVDSLDVQVRAIQAEWDSADQAPDAARRTAHLVLEDLRARPDAVWEIRARHFLDSLAIGAEVAGESHALAINLFSRSNPEAGSWPFLLAGDGTQSVVQPLEGRGMRLQDLARYGSDVVAVMFAVRGGAGFEPLVQAWRRAGDRWTLAQTLGPDSLGGVGEARFISGSDTSLALEARTFTNTPRFDECAGCPHLYQVHRFRWEDQGFVRTGLETEESPYASFVHFIQALADDDLMEARRWTADPALVDSALLHRFGVAQAPWRVAPAAVSGDGEIVFFRGQREAYSVTFERRGATWLISTLKPASRTIE